MNRGVTLLEALVAAALSLLVLGLVTALLVFGFRTWHKSDARSQAQEQTLLALSQLVAQVRHADPDSIFLPAPQSITLVSGQGPDGGTVLDPNSGDVLWQKRVALYYDSAAQRLMLQERALEPPVSDIDAAALMQTSVTPDPKDRIVARNLTMVVLDLRNGVVHARVEASVEGIRCQQETFVAAIAPPAPTATPSP